MAEDSSVRGAEAGAGRQSGRRTFRRPFGKQSRLSRNDPVEIPFKTQRRKGAEDAEEKEPAWRHSPLGGTSCQGFSAVSASLRLCVFIRPAFLTASFRLSATSPAAPLPFSTARRAGVC